MSNIEANDNTKQPNKHMAEVFGGDANAGTIPVHRSTMEAEPVIYTGAFLDTATEEQLTAMILEDFKRHGVHERRVKIMGGKLRGEYVVKFDGAYESCAWMPMAIALEAARIEAEGKTQKPERMFTDVQLVDRRTRTPHDEENSQLRIRYDEDDPAKDRTLQFIKEIHSHTQYPDDTLYMRTTWLDAYKLLTAVQHRNVGVNCTHNKDGAPVMSGYELIREGLLNEEGEVTVTLTPEEAPPTTHEELKAAVLALAPHRGTPEFVMLTVKAQSEVEVVPILAKYSTHEPTGIAHTEPDSYTVRFLCTNLPGLTSALLKDFSHFHLRWIDRVWTSDKTNIPVVARFGESWTTDFKPLWFKTDADGDRYYDGATVLVWNRLGYEFLTGDTLVKVGSPDSEYTYGKGATVESGKVDRDAVDAAIVAAAQEGKHYSTVLDGRFEI